MKVARTYAFEDTRVEESAVPPLEPGDALVRVEACGLCGSDATRWYVETKAPAVLGHEPAGVVVETGEGCPLEVGQRVFFHHHVSCEVCHACKRGFETNCTMFRSTRLDPGGFAELSRVPAENVRRDTLVLPDAVSFEQATFIEPVACCIRAVDKLRIRPGESVLIIGMGAMGLVNGRLAKQRGAGLLLGTDLSEVRAARGPEWGFDHVFDPRTDDFLERVHAVTDGRGVDHVIVGPASQAALDQAAQVAGSGATICLFSPFSPDRETTLPLNTYYFRELTLVTSYSCAAKETREALELIADGVVPVDQLVSHRLGLDGVGDGILDTARHGDDWLRAVVYPHGAPDA
jgi:L-iditol 2-dehydrogenase